MKKFLATALALGLGAAALLPSADVDAQDRDRSSHERDRYGRDHDGDRNHWDRDRRDRDGARHRDGGRRDWDGDRNRYSYSHRDNDRRWDRRHGDNDRRWDRDHHRRWEGNRYRYRAPARYVYPHGYASYRWNVGHRLPRSYYGSSYYVDYRPYGLAPPPYGYRYVRVDNDVVLVAIATGLISNIIHDLFYY